MESKKVEFFNKLSFLILLFTLFVSLFFFIPYVPVALEVSKGFLVSIGATLSLFFWLIGRLGDGKFVIPRDKLIIFGLAIPLVFLLASFFSASSYASLFGANFEVGTFSSMLVLFIIFFLSSIHFQKEKHLWTFMNLLMIGGLILVLFELVSLFLNFNVILPGLLQGVSSGNLAGSWNNFALLLGVLILLSTFTLELIKVKAVFKIFQYVLLVLGILLLVIINFPLAWLLVGTFSLIIFVYSLSIQHSGSKIIHTDGGKKKFPFVSLVVLFVSFAFMFGSNLIGDFTSNYVSLNNPDVRPSITSTSQIILKSIKHNPVFGTSPNTFLPDWTLWQPKDIAQTIFWNVDFTSGYSLFMTFIATTGLAGLAVILLFLVIYFVRGFQSIRIALKNTQTNYFIITILMISVYSWLTVILYNPNVLLLALAFSTSGMLIGVLVSRQAIRVKEFSFLSDPRHSFFSILGLVILMAVTASLTYVYIGKFTSMIYFSRGMNSTNTIESLSNAERMFIKAISLNKNDFYYRALSQVYIREIGLLVNDETISNDILKSTLQQLVNSAQDTASSAVRQNKNLYLNYMNLGNVYSSLVPLAIVNSYESANFAYNRALELSPNNPSIILAKASLEFIHKNNDEARRLIKDALEIKFNYVDAIFLLVQIETNEGNLPEAIKQAENGSLLAPNDPTVFFRLGLLRYYDNNYEGAISAFEKAVILNNSYLNARYFLGKSYSKVGRIDEALVQFNILSKFTPDNQEVKDAIKSINNPKTEKDTKTKDIKTKLPLPESQ